MTTPEQHSSLRVGDEERTAAIEALNEHWRGGRLDPAEHERRTTAAHAAVTRGDLDSLFTDLPAAGQVVAPGVSGSGRAVSAESSATALVPQRSWVGRHRDQLMGVAPFVSLVGFFALGHNWLWFLLIPALGALLYAGDDQDQARQDRRRRRDERRSGRDSS